jgi:bifunctional non-homologous end joining protein LigD
MPRRDSKLLEKYQKMRDFGDTPEPSGKKEPKRGRRPVFVVQKHAATALHYDTRLEMEGVLKSWAVPKGPSYDPTVKRLAMMTEDHPFDYKDFEGVIPEGNYGAGNVIIWDEGTWEFIEPGDDPVEAVRKGKLTFKLYGKKLLGEWTLVRIGGRRPGSKGNEWLLMKHRDQYANSTFDVTEKMPQSVVSGKVLEEIGSERQWISNRPAAGKGRTRTVADALREKSNATSPPKTAAKKKPAPKRKTAKAKS